MSLIDNTYISILETLKNKIRQSRYNASKAVNIELLKLYWEIGDTIIRQQNEQGWGAKIIDNLSRDLRLEFPDFKGVSVRNLKYMKAFAEAYPSFLSIVQVPLAQLENNIQNEFVQVPLAQLTWYHHITLIDKIKDSNVREFYITKCAENGWSRDIMVRQIETKLHEKQGNAITNFKQTLPALDSDLAQQTIKSTYSFDFISFSEDIKEREFEKALIQHLKKFMLELGKGFAYVGNQKNIDVAGDDYFFDLLFYNYHLHCFVVFELKVGDFKPEYAGKLGFYVNTINKQLKGIDDKPTIGVLLCKTQNKTVIQYSLEVINSPIGVADYEFSQALPAEFKSEIPSIEELEAEIDKEYEELKSPSQKRLDVLKQKIKNLADKTTSIHQKDADYAVLLEKSFIPLYKTVLNKLKDYDDLFITHEYYWQFSKGQVIALEEMKPEHFIPENYINSRTCNFELRLMGFKSAGTEAFDVWNNVNLHFNDYYYGIDYRFQNDNEPKFKKLYTENFTDSEIEEISERVINEINDQIEERLTRLQLL